ncbi:MAG: flp pilus-assembly TadE/G-like family protein [Bowdeniella nasicola]|nr:flp pilus-assembly TadE/G-like family protein [Bowdeniella nasicola]
MNAPPTTTGPGARIEHAVRAGPSHAPPRRRRSRHRHHESGSVTVLAVGLLGVLSIVLAILMVGAQIRIARSHAQALADLAALSGGPDLSAGCAIAEELARRHGASVQACGRDGLEMRVRLTLQVAPGLGSVSASARARPAWLLGAGSTSPPP